MSASNIEPTGNEYEITVAAGSEEEAIIAFNESFDDDQNYTEATDLHRYDEDTFGVFFWSEKQIDTNDEPMVIAIEEIEGDN